MKSKKNDANLNISVEILTGSDALGFNAVINAIRAGNFINFSNHYTEDLEYFFTKSWLTKVENKVEKKIDLSMGYKHLSIMEVQQCFNQVLAIRKEELKPLLELTPNAFEKLNDLDKMRYNLIYHYGDKIAGFPVVGALSITELIKMNNYFNAIVEQQNKAIN